MFDTYRSIALFTLILSCIDRTTSFAPRPVGSTFNYLSKLSQNYPQSNTKLAMSTEPLKLDKDRTAVVFVEYQNEFTTEGGKLYGAVKDCMEATGTLDNAKKVLEAARKAGITVVHVPISFEKGHNEIRNDIYGILSGVKNGEAFTVNEWGSEICESMTPIASDFIVSGKRGLCGFASTNLDFILRQQDVKNILLGGFLTNCCIESTMRTAYEHGYNVYTLKDCCAATSVAGQEAAFEHTFGMFSIPTMSTDVIAALEAS